MVCVIGLIAFYLFATVTIASAVAVIFARNPVHSVLWLIVAFFNSAGLMLLLGAEFTQVLSRRRGHEVAAEPGARRVAA